MRTMFVVLALIISVFSYAEAATILATDCHDTCSEPTNAPRYKTTSGCISGECQRIDVPAGGDLARPWEVYFTPSREITILYWERFSVQPRDGQGGVKSNRPFFSPSSLPKNYFGAVITQHADYAGYAAIFMNVFEDAYVTYGPRVYKANTEYCPGGHCVTLHPEEELDAQVAASFANLNGDGISDMGTVWRKMRSYIKMPSSSTASDGAFTLWIDEELIYSLSNVKISWSDASTIGQVRFAPQDASAVAFSHYYDEITIYSGYVGPDGYEPPIDEIAPDVVSVTVGTNGKRISVTFSEPVKGTGGFTLSPSGGATSLTYVSGINSSTLFFDATRTEPIQYYETATIAYTKPGSNFVEDIAGNDLASFGTSAVTVYNYSTQGSTPPTGSFPCSNTNPIIIDNDEYDDVYDQDYLMALASIGEIQLKGIITSSSITPYNPYVLSADFDRMHADKLAAASAATASGLKNIPTPIEGVKGNLTKPLSGDIDDTISIGSAGSTLIVTQANLASVEVPLVVVVGGPLTTVADAYLIDPTIANKVIVAYLGDSTSGMDGYNGWADGWAANIVLQRIKMVIFPVTAFYDVYTPVVLKADLAELPTNTWSTMMYDKDHATNDLPDDQDADGPPAIAIMLGDVYALTTQNVQFSSLQNLDLEGTVHEVPMFTAGGTSSIRVVTADRDAATVEWWRAIRSSLDTPPIMFNLSPAGSVACVDPTGLQPITYELDTYPAATCRGTVTNLSYADMGAGAVFDQTGGTHHISVASPGVGCGSSFLLYVQCQDANGKTTVTPGIISSSVLRTIRAPNLYIISGGLAPMKFSEGLVPLLGN